MRHPGGKKGPTEFSIDRGGNVTWCKPQQALTADLPVTFIFHVFFRVLCDERFENGSHAKVGLTKEKAGRKARLFSCIAVSNVVQAKSED